MSRLAKKPILVPQGITVALDVGSVAVKGPLGELSMPVKSEVFFVQDPEGISLTIKKNTKQAKALLGTYASLLKSMIKGVKEKYQKKLILEGVGFKSEVSGTNLKLALGFSHPVLVPIPTGITVTAEKNVISISGIDKGQVGEFAAKVRALKKPEPYKGKGFHYDDEVVRRKQGKKSV